MAVDYSVNRQLKVDGCYFLVSIWWTILFFPVLKVSPVACIVAFSVVSCVLILAATLLLNIIDVHQLGGAATET
jgi:hypothetical protein